MLCLVRGRPAYTPLLVLILCSMPFSLAAQPKIPQPRAFYPINVTSGPSFSPSSTRFQSNLSLHDDPYREQNLRLMQQGGMTVPGPSSVKRERQMEQVREAQQENATFWRETAAATFISNFQQFLQMDPNNFSITRAVYLTESAYDLSLPPYETFQTAVRQWGDLAKQILKQKGLTDTGNIALNYAIQHLYQQSATFYDRITKKNITVQPIRYDFTDPMGDKDWRQMFVAKLLNTGTGQCHSLPLFYLCVAEQLGANAYLSLSPNHSFIQFFDEQGYRYNFETTSGNLVTQNWLMQSTHINATALKNKTYLDTLSKRKLYAQCLADFLLGYVQKLGYDRYSEQISGQILRIDSTNLSALMIQSNYRYYIFQDKVRQAGNPPLEQLSQYPQIEVAFKELQFAQNKVEQTGFQQMPDDAYERWLRSAVLEKQRQQNKLEQQRWQQAIKKLKKVKPTLINHSK